MAQTVSVIVSAADRARLVAIVGDRSRPLKHVQRARIVLYSADRLSVLKVARRAEVSRPAVWRWQRHYAEDGVERLLREGSRKPGKPPVPLLAGRRQGRRAYLFGAAGRSHPLDRPGDGRSDRAFAYHHSAHLEGP